MTTDLPGTTSSEPALPAELLETKTSLIDLSGRAALLKGADALPRTAGQLAALLKAPGATKQDAENAGIFLRAVRTRIRAIQTHYKTVRAPVRRALAELSDLERHDLLPWMEADAAVDAPLLAWLAEDKRRVDEQNTRILAEAEAKARADRDRQAQALRDAAAQASTARDARALQAQARQVERSEPLPVVTGTAERAKIEGISVPTRRIADVVNLKALLRAVAAGKVPEDAVKPNQAWLDDQARDRGKDLNFPGVVVREVPTLSARGL